MAIPDHLTEEEAREIVRESETVLEVTQKARVNRKRAKRLLRHFEKYDEMKTGSDIMAESDIEQRASHGRPTM